MFEDSAAAIPKPETGNDRDPVQFILKTYFCIDIARSSSLLVVPAFPEVSRLNSMLISCLPVRGIHLAT